MRPTDPLAAYLSSLSAARLRSLARLASLRWFDRTMVSDMFGRDADLAALVNSSPLIAAAGAKNRLRVVGVAADDLPVDPEISRETSREAANFYQDKAAREDADLPALAAEAILYTARFDRAEAAQLLLAYAQRLLAVGRLESVLRSAAELLDGDDRPALLARLVRSVVLEIAIAIEPIPSAESLITDARRELVGDALSVVGRPQGPGEEWIVALAGQAVQRSRRVGAGLIPRATDLVIASRHGDLSSADAIFDELLGMGSPVIRRDELITFENFQTMRRRSATSIFVDDDGVHRPVFLALFPWRERYLVDAAEVRDGSRRIATLTSVQAVEAMTEAFVEMVRRGEVLAHDVVRGDYASLHRRLRAVADADAGLVPSIMRQYVDADASLPASLIRGVPLFALPIGLHPGGNTFEFEVEQPVTESAGSRFSGVHRLLVVCLLGSSRLEIRTPAGFILLDGRLRVGGENGRRVGRVAKDGRSQTFIIDAADSEPQECEFDLSYAVDPRERIRIGMVAAFAGAVSAAGLALTAGEENGPTAIFSAIAAATLIGLVELVLRRGLGDGPSDRNRSQRRALFPAVAASAATLVVASIASGVAVLDAERTTRIAISVIALILSILIWAAITLRAKTDLDRSRRFAAFSRSPGGPAQWPGLR